MYTNYVQCHLRNGWNMVEPSQQFIFHLFSQTHTVCYHKFCAIQYSTAYCIFDSLNPFKVLFMYSKYAFRWQASWFISVVLHRKKITTGIIRYHYCRLLWNLKRKKNFVELLAFLWHLHIEWLNYVEVKVSLILN